MGRPRSVTDEQIIATARRWFLGRGASVPATEIASELGVSHTTLFNRFGSKEGLLLAALEPPREVAWVEALENGPDNRPIREQLVEHARVISAFYSEMEAGLSLLRAAGVEHGSGGCVRGPDGEQSAAERGYNALVAWLDRAQQQESLAICDSRTLASTILGALHGWTLTATACGQGAPPDGEGPDAGGGPGERRSTGGGRDDGGRLDGHGNSDDAAHLDDGGRYVERFVDLLWHGIGPRATRDAAAAAETV